MLLTKLVTVAGQLNNADNTSGALNKIDCCHWLKLKQHSTRFVFSKIDDEIDRISKRETMQEVFLGTFDVVV